MNCACGRPALYRQPKTGRLKARADHDMCPRCWRDQANRDRAERLGRRSR